MGGQPVSLFLPCAAGVEPLLADECAALLGVDRSVVPADPSRRPVVELRGGVQVLGDAQTAMRLNLESRLAQRVLWPLAFGPYQSEHDLYDLARRVPWTDWITPEQTFRIDTSAQRSPLQSLNFATLRVKDAVCDVLRDATGSRPSVDTRNPDLPLVLHLTADTASLYADTSGEALFKRGWRDARDGGLKGEAPLKETLAAAMLAAAGWQGRAEDGALLDPCCGAGTIAIEAAQIACGIAPGLKRRFAFERMLPFRPLAADWARLKAEAQARIHAPAVAIHAGDVSFRMTDFAARNAQRAGVAQAIQFKTGDALQRPAPAESGVLVLNPPYGERIAPKGSRGEARDARAAREGFEAVPDGGGDAAAEAAQAFFSGLATHWKRGYSGWTAWVLSPDMKLPQALRLKESRRVPMWNGPIECRLFRFDLVAGSARGGDSAAG
ncbi:MAG: class I SAM-dependent RNA methyltransferase [Burkholderiaceae bacterium]|nr:class I SAM-dependent RNA methyltransferase [Burkholderiaceae bacterium]